jgi:hypothetical protein
MAHDAQQRFPQILGPLLILGVGRDHDAHAAATNQNLPIWLDPDGALHHKLAVTDPTLIVVRPDGYIGYRCQPAASAPLLKYLDHYLIAKR